MSVREQLQANASFGANPTVPLPFVPFSMNNCHTYSC